MDMATNDLAVPAAPEGWLRTALLMPNASLSGGRKLDQPVTHKEQQT